MENLSPEAWTTELAAEFQRLSGLFHDGSPDIRLAPGERRLVAVLFLDLKNYTGLAEKLDHETLHHLVRSLMRLLAREVESAGGYVDKYEGDMIMALFGAGGYSEVPCQRAVSCGLKMLERVRTAAGILQRQGISLGARAGVSYGPVTVAPDPSGHLTATGDEVNVASRLQSQAPDGGLMVSAAVRRAAGDYFSWVDDGEKTIRGRSEPVHAYLAEGAGPLRRNWWREASRYAGVPFVDRLEEISRLMVLLEMRSGPRVAVVTGEPGSGKTALVTEAVSRLDNRDGPLVITGRSMAFDQPPYWLWREVLRDLARKGDDPEEHLRSLLEGRGSGEGSFTLDAAEGLVRSVLSGDFRGQLEDGPVDSDGMVSGLVRDALGAEAARSGGLALVLDDLHWMDSRSAAVLEALLQEEPPPGVVAVLLSREPIAAAAGTDAVDIRLEGLDDSALEEMAEHLLRGRSGLVPEEITLLTRRTGRTVGRYPLYFRDMILYLMESGSLEAACGGEGLDAGLGRIPGTLAALVASRFDQLPEEHRRMLQYASVLGQGFPRDLLARYLQAVRRETSPPLPDDTDSALALLLRKRLLRTGATSAGETVSFRTPLARRVAYDTLLLHNRRILHGIAARLCLEPSSPPGHMPGMAARHLRLAGDLPGAMREGLEELRQASDGYKTTEAIDWCDRLMEWAAERESGARADSILEILDRRRFALELEGRIEECRRTLERMVDLADSHGLPDWKARAMIGMGSLMSVTGAPQRALELLEKAALVAGPQGEKELLALSLANKASCLVRLGRLAEAEDNLDSAIGLADAVGDPPLAARCLLVRSQLEMGMGRLGEAEATLRDLISRESGPSVRIRMAATANLGAVLSGVGRLEEAGKSFAEAMRGAESIGDSRVQASCLCNLAALRRRSGDPHGALDDLEKALSLARELGDGNLEGEALLNMGTAMANMGRPEEAFRRSLQAFEALRRLGGSRHLGLALRNAAVFAGDAATAGIMRGLMDALESAGGLLDPDELAAALVAAAQTARRKGMLIRVAQLCGRAESMLAGAGGETLAEIRALQAVCHLEGGSRREAAEALREAEKLAGPSPRSEDLRRDLRELGAVLER